MVSIIYLVKMPDDLDPFADCNANDRESDENDLWSSEMVIDLD